MKAPTPSQHRSNSPSLLGIAKLSALFFVIFCSGCISPKSYVDPRFRETNYADLKPLDQPHPVVLTVHFLVNGQPKQQVDSTLRSAVRPVLAKSRVFTESGDSSSADAGHLDVTVNDVGNMGASRAKGFGTGLTLGLVGSEVVDGYVMTATYAPPNGTPITKSYNHAIHTTIGVHGAPEGMEPMPLPAAFRKVVEDMLLNFFRDVQKAGL
jgi:hypothetical protein